MKRIYLKNKNIFYSIIGIIIFFTYLLVFNDLNKKRRLNTFETGVYTIAKITELRKETRSVYYKYEFYYRNLRFESRTLQKKEYRLEVGKKYFVIIDPKQPSINNFILKISPVPDSITEAPPEGWKELPILVDKEKIRQFLEEY